MKTNETPAATCFKFVGPAAGASALALITAKVQAIDLDPIKRRLMDPRKSSGWTRERADAVEQDYRNFLVLAAFEPAAPTVPTEDVDEMWHAHILDTMKYQADCMEAFGYFVHHRPSDANDEIAAAGDDTQRRMEELLGVRMGGEGATCGLNMTCDRVATCSRTIGETHSRAAIPIA